MKHVRNRTTLYCACFVLLCLLCFFLVKAEKQHSLAISTFSSTAPVDGEHRIQIASLSQDQVVIIEASPAIDKQNAWAYCLSSDTFGLTSLSFSKGRAEYNVDTPGDYSFIVPHVAANTTFTIEVRNVSGR